MRIFEDKLEEVGCLWNRVVCFASFCVSVVKEFRGVPLFVLKSDWTVACFFFSFFCRTSRPLLYFLIFINILFFSRFKK